MSAEPAHPSLELAVVVAALLNERGIECALIGAGALAVHQYPRATRDLDLCTDVNPFERLPEIQEQLESEGQRATLHLPDATDPLGGVLRVAGPAGARVDVVNYYNPLSARPTNIGRRALRHALIADIDGVELRVVDRPHLIALKLYAGGPKSRSDIIALLAANPTLDFDEVEATCEQVGLRDAWRRLVASLPQDG